MRSDLNDADRRRPRNRTGAHRRIRRRGSWIARSLAAGGVAVCLGAAYDLSTPTADALSILLPGRTVDGVANTTRINILEGNIFNPQFALSGGNTSNNNTIGNVLMNLGNNIVNQLLSAQINLAGTVGNGNTTQINILSYNIFNPQVSLIGPNISNNTTVSNVAINNGNNSSTTVTAGGGLPLFGAMAGNGNAVQFSFFSGNIFNPQISLFGGGNVGYNTAVTNVAMNNGNLSQATLAWGGWFGTFLFGGGNGNTFQYGFFVSNIFNPQISFGGGNISYNTATTNTASGNGNNSDTNAGSGLVGGTNGNGNTNQGAIGSGNISNDQVNIGPGSTPVITTPPPDPIDQLLNSRFAPDAAVDTGAGEEATNRAASPTSSDMTTDDLETDLATDDLGDTGEDATTEALNGRSTSRGATPATAVNNEGTAPGGPGDPTPGTAGDPGPGTGATTDTPGGDVGAGGDGESE